MKRTDSKQEESPSKKFKAIEPQAAGKAEVDARPNNNVVNDRDQDGELVQVTVVRPDSSTHVVSIRLNQRIVALERFHDQLIHHTLPSLHDLATVPTSFVQVWHGDMAHTA